MATVSSQADAPPLANRLGWQGWQIDLPGDWNPVRLTGSARAGQVFVADLERPRLELRWRRVRSARRVDLSRLAGPSSKSEPLTWQPLPCGDKGGIASGRRAVASDGTVLAMLLSRGSPRLVFVRIPGTPADDADPLAGRLLASISDASGRDPVPWSVFGFNWSVPACLQLVGQHFAAGRAALTFRRGRRWLGVERWAMAAGARNQPPDRVAITNTTPIQHRGHEIPVTRRAPHKLWDRLMGGQSWRAEWACEASKRHFRLETGGSEAAETLEAAVTTVRCH